VFVHRAPVVLPVIKPPISDGAVVTENGMIVAVGPYARLRSLGKTVEYDNSVLLPALVNCHIHLELSQLAELGRQNPHHGDMPVWISELLDARQKTVPDDGRAARLALDDMYTQGVALVADIGNMPGSKEIGQGHPVQVDFYLEMLGFAHRSAVNAMAKMRESLCDCTSHAPYSNHPDLLIAAKQRARSRNRIFSIHVAESQAEIDFLRDGNGLFRSFIEQRGFWDGSFVPPGCGAIDYLDRLGLIDEHTLCVHCVYVSDKEIALLANHHAKVCLCPGSNQFLGVGKAPVEKMIEAGIAPGLGTDSLASNPRLSIWEEMRIMRENYPSVSPAKILAMATINGAQCLGNHEIGCLAPGRRAGIIAVNAKGLKAENAEDFLTSFGHNISVDWVKEAR